MLIRVTKV